MKCGNLHFNHDLDIRTPQLPSIQVLQFTLNKLHNKCIILSTVSLKVKHFKIQTYKILLKPATFCTKIFKIDQAVKAGKRFKEIELGRSPIFRTLPSLKLCTDFHCSNVKMPITTCQCAPLTQSWRLCPRDEAHSLVFLI